MVSCFWVLDLNRQFFLMDKFGYGAVRGTD